MVLGAVKGNVSASYVEIRSAAKIQGDTRYETIEMHQGSEVNGRLLRIDGGTVTETPDVQLIPAPVNAVA